MEAFKKAADKDILRRLETVDVQANQTRPDIELLIIPGPQSDLEKLGYTFEFNDIVDGVLMWQIWFDDPPYVSSGVDSD